MSTSMSVTHSMQRRPLRGSSTGYLAQFPSSVVPLPQPSYSQQAVQAGVNYLQQVPGEALSTYVPLPPFREPGTLYVLSLVRHCFPILSLFGRIGDSYRYISPVPKEQQAPGVPLPPLREAGMFWT